MNKDKILAQAKEIMDEFAKALEVVQLDEEVGIERDQQTREGEASDSDVDFIERFQKNAPKTKDGYIVAEKRKW